MAKKTTRKFLIDAAERVGATFVEAAAGALVASTVFDLSTLRAAGVAGLTAAAAVVKTLAASFLGKRGSAALLPASVDPTRGT